MPDSKAEWTENEINISSNGSIRVNYSYTRVRDWVNEARLALFDKYKHPGNRHRPLGNLSQLLYTTGQLEYQIPTAQ